jgi:3',5'-cyclic AMP phosphodiesterase CpdA
MSKITKYGTYIIAVIIIGLAGFLTLSGNIKNIFQSKSGKDKTIYITSDLHYLSDSLTDNGDAYQKYISTGDGKQLEYIDEIFDAFADNIRKKRPDILIISGDLTNNGEKASHLELSEKLKKIEKSGTLVYVIPGNHDIYNPWARSFQGDKQVVAENISDTDFSRIYADFGYNEAISKDENSLSYLAAPSDDLWLLMLDTNKYNDNISVGIPSADGILKSSTLKWIQQCSDLAKEKGAVIITVMHHNILNHSEVIQEGFTLNNSGQALIQFKEDNLNLVFSGHIHVQDISSDQKGTVPLYDIASGALPVYPHQYGILKYSAKERSFQYNTTMVDVAGWAKRKGIKDENLRNFDQYSKEYFEKISYNKFLNKLLMETDYPKDKIELMAETMETLNLRYFAGTENLNSKDIINSEGYKLLTDSQEGFMKNYVLSITSDKDTDDTNLYIKLPDKTTSGN